MNKNSSDILQDLKKKRERLLKTVFLLTLLSTLNSLLFFYTKNLVTLYLLTLCIALLMQGIGRLIQVISIIDVAKLIDK